MFLLDKDTKKMCLDFQLIYDVDANIHLDFYADGLCEEPKYIFGIENIFEKISYGFVVADHDKFEDYEKNILGKRVNDKLLREVSTKMVNSIFRMKESSEEVEKKIIGKTLDYKDIETYYKEIIEMMAYRRISDIYQHEIESLNDHDLIKILCEIEVPSYIMILNKKLKELKMNPSEEQIQEFIFNYGFLGDFSISKCEFEMEDFIREKLELILAEDMKQKKEISDLGNMEKYKEQLELYKNIVFYEEYRHYYQLRALRNFRLIFELLNLDIYNTDIQKLKLHYYK